MRTTVLLPTLGAALVLATVTITALASPPAIPPATSSAAVPSPPPPPRVATDANGEPMPPVASVPAAPNKLASVTKPSPFVALDRTNAGVITKEQANADPWLSTRFSDCDTDHNDQVTQSEYDACCAQLH